MKTAATEAPEVLSDETLKRAAKIALKRRPLPDYRQAGSYPRLPGDA